MERENMKSKAMMAIVTVAALIFLSGVSAAGERMSVSTDKATYLMGEDVTIVLTNEYKEDIVLNGYWIEDAAGQRVYIPPMPSFVQYLAPGESYAFVWNQIDEFGNQVSEGYYTVNIDGDSTDIDVIEDPVVLSTADDAFAVGDEVAITLTNTAESVVFVPGGYTVLNEMGEVVYAENVLAFMLPLMPGESLQYAWGQTTDGGEQVADGTYIICSSRSQVTITIVSDTHGSAADDRPANGAHVPEPTVEPVVGNRPAPRTHPKSIF